MPSEDPGEDVVWLTRIECIASSLEDCVNAMPERTLYTRNRAGRGLNEQDIDSYIKSSCSDDVRTAWRGLYRFSPGFFTPREPYLEE